MKFHRYLHRFFTWLPADQRKPLLQRLCIVWALALPIALGVWLGHQNEWRLYPFRVSLVYSYAISTSIWLFTDVPRFAFKRLLRTQAPFYWPPALQASVMLLLGIPLGYGLGTALGDAYAGWSTWQLWWIDPRQFIRLLLGSVLVSAGFVWFFYQRAKTQALARQVTQAQLMLLQSQLEPHMLFNTLAHLRVLIGQDTARALTMLDHLDDYLRTTLQASRQPLHPLADEFSRLRDYLSLMAIRMGTRLAFDLQLAPALQRVPVPSFILQPLVENAIRHGLEPCVAGGRITVSAHVQPHAHAHTHIQSAALQLTVQDNGSGISEQALADAHLPAAPDAAATASWGLGHVRQRLHTLYGERASLHIRRIATGGTCVVLTMPFEPSPSP